MPIPAYGIALPKKLGRDRGVNPVWYVDINPSHDWPSKYFSQLVSKAIASGAFEESDIARLAPLIEQMGSSALHGYRKEFWWEREWRHIGDFSLPLKMIILCPEDEIEGLRASLEAGEVGYRAKFIDPYWNLEQIIARLAGFPASDTDTL